MFKYIKWELKDFYKKYYKVGIGILILYALMALIPINFYQESVFSSLILIPFILTITVLMLGTFVYGTKRVIDTFKKPTFLLESMISYSPKKILLAKYLLAFIINVIFSVLLFLRTVCNFNKIRTI